MPAIMSPPLFENVLAPRHEVIYGVTRGAQVTGVAVASLCLSWLAVCARFYVRIRMQKMFGPEDWLTVASMIVFTALCGLLLNSLQYGLGFHMINIPADSLVTLAKIIFASELLYVITMALTKVSIGFYFFRLACRRYQVIIIYTVMVAVSIYSIMYLFFLLFQCHPVSYFWTQFDNGQGHCINKDTLANITYVHAALSAITDWAFGLLPLTFVWKLKMNPRTKLSVVLILSLGFFASTATIVRIVYIQTLERTSDYSWEGINLTKWSLVEPAIAITAAGIAILRPLFQKFLFRQRPFESYSTSDVSTMHPKSSFATARDSGESYGEEFAEMLGLRRVGVTTLIFADRVILSREGPNERPRLGDTTASSSDSQTWLKTGCETGEKEEVSGDGIHAITTITTQVEE